MDDGSNISMTTAIKRVVTTPINATIKCDIHLQNEMS